MGEKGAFLHIKDVEAVLMPEATRRRVEAERVSQRDQRMLFQLEATGGSVLVDIDIDWRNVHLVDLDLLDLPELHEVCKKRTCDLEVIGRA